MNYILSDFGPNNLFRYFEELCAIPHGSGNEKQIALYLCDFAQKNGLEYYKDDLNNVLIKKPASKGYEKCPAVLLQAHTDMVCEKNKDTEHDFLNEGLNLYEKDGWLYAKGTTLGADDATGVALMMALLSNNTAKHPPLECLFTVQEETGMDGAFNFDYSKLCAKSFINLDSETLNTPIVSCAGGIHSKMIFTFDRYKLQNDTVKITISGLAGGHSGTDINSGRENANIVMGKLLCHLYDSMPFNIVSIDGGNKTNAIPRECECVISVFDYKRAKNIINDIVPSIKKYLVDSDKNMSVKVSKESTDKKFMFSLKDTSRIIETVNLIPNGVISMSISKPDFVETSSNLGIIKTENNSVIFEIMPRSSVDRKLDETVQKINLLGKVLGANVIHGNKYMGWEYKKESKIREIFSGCYERKFSKKPVFEAIHAGLECGIILSHMGDLDGISIGPEVLEIHTPNECLNIKSFSDAYEITLEMLERMK